MAGHRSPRRRRHWDLPGGLVPRPRRGDAHHSPTVPVQRRPLQARLRLVMMAEAGCFPLWLETGSQVSNIPAAELPVPGPLAQDIAAWGEACPRAEDQDPEFYAHGLRLALRLAESLGPADTVQFLDGREGILRRI